MLPWVTALVMKAGKKYLQEKSVVAGSDLFTPRWGHCSVCPVLCSLEICSKVQCIISFLNSHPCVVARLD
jgi:hypothetical protein